MLEEINLDQNGSLREDEPRTERTSSDAPDSRASRVQRGGKQRQLEVACWNARGMKHKISKRMIDLLDNVDVFGVCETGYVDERFSGLDGFCHYGISAGVPVMGARGESKGTSIYWRTATQVSITPIAHSSEDPDLVWVKAKQRGGGLIFIGCYYAPQHNSSEASTTYERVAEMIKAFKERGEVILMGDFNARTGLTHRNQDPVRNLNGPRLLQLERDLDMTILDLPSNIPPWTRIEESSTGISRSVLDYILVSRGLVRRDGYRARRLFNLVNESFGSDHAVVQARVCVTAKRARLMRPKCRRVPNFFALRDGIWDAEDGPPTKAELIATRNEFADILSKPLEEWRTKWRAAEISEQKDIDEAYEEFSTLLKEAVKKQFGTRLIGGNRRSKSWWNREIEQLVRERTRHFKRVRRSPRELIAERWKDYLEARSRAKKAIVEAKKRAWDGIMDKLVEASEAPSSKIMWDVVKRVTKKPPSGADPTRVRADDGSITSSTTEALQAWRSHFKAVTNPLNDEDEFNERNREVIELMDSAMDSDPLPQEEVLLTTQAVLSAIKTLPNASQAGPDEIPNVVLKYACGHFQKPTDVAASKSEEARQKDRQTRFALALATLFNLCAKSGLTPQIWNDANQVPIPKASAEEDPMERGNYRGITMSSCVGKLYFKVLLRTYLSANYEEEMHHEQGGFRSRRRCAHQHFLLAEALHNAVEAEQPLYITFVDLKKAYPSTWRAGLFYRLRTAKHKLNERVIRLLKNAINTGTTRILLNGQRSEPYSSSCGLREGASESPMMFNYFINELISELKSRCDGVKSLGLTAALFADDIAIVSDNRDDMQRSLNVLHEFCRMWRLTVTLDKTKVMVVNRSEDDDGRPFAYGASELEEVTKYKYLGLWFTNNAQWGYDLNARIRKAKRVQGNIMHILTQKKLPIRLRWHVWCGLVRSRLEYGCEIAVPGEAHLKEMEQMQTYVLRRILGCNSRTALAAVRGDLNVETMKVRQAKLRIRLYQEICRKECHIPLHQSVFNKSTELAVEHPESSFRMSCVRLINSTLMGNDSLETWFLNPGSADEPTPDRGWQEARQRIMKRYVDTWHDEINDKVTNSDKSQLQLYQKLKQTWGPVPYTTFRDGHAGGLLFKVRSGTLPVFGFEGKKDSEITRGCMSCGERKVEDIDHFLYYCTGGLEAGEGLTRRDSRKLMLRQIRSKLFESRLLYENYGADRLSDSWNLWKLALGTPVEEVFDKAFAFAPNPPSAVYEQLEECYPVVPEMRGIVNGINQAVLEASMQFLSAAWKKRCRHIDELRQSGDLPDRSEDSNLSFDEGYESDIDSGCTEHLNEISDCDAPLNAFADTRSCQSGVCCVDDGACEDCVIDPDNSLSTELSLSPRYFPIFYSRNYDRSRRSSLGDTGNTNALPPHSPSVSTRSWLTNSGRGYAAQGRPSAD